MFTYFTIKSANEALPGIIEKFKNIKKEKNELMKAEQELQSHTSNLEEYIIKKQKLNSVMTKLSQLIEDLEATGVCLLYTSPSPRDRG